MDEAIQYRLKNEQRLLRQHAKMMSIGEKLIVDRYGRRASNEIIEQSTREFHKLLPELPYIGGKTNSMTGTIAQGCTHCDFRFKR